MRASYEWLKALSGVDVSPLEMARRLTSVGLEVEGITHRGEGLDHVVVAEVRGKRSHPSKDQLTLVTVFDGASEREIVCGAPNVPEAGRRVILAGLGAKLPNGMVIAERKVAGVLSAGMLCAETELDIGTDDDGIFVFPAGEAPAPGTPIVEALALRDVVLEIGLTPNRPDCLGHLGLARELALVSGVAFAPPGESQPIARFAPARSDEAGVAVEIRDAKRCPRYGAARVSGTRIGPSPFWLRYRLHCLGLRPISNVVDVTNLVMLEHGHPIHAFDAARLRTEGGLPRIVVRTASDGESMQTLDGVARTFTHDDLLICDAETPVALAGVMGGEHSGIDEGTSDVLVECAYFDPRSVRRTARRQGMHTDASHRFERGVDPNGVRAVLQRAASLIAELAGGSVAAEAVDAYPAAIDEKVVTLRLARASSLLGYDVPVDAIRRVILGIGARIVREDEATLDVALPTFRPDLGREVDVIEEIARIHGYDRIPTTMPRVRPSTEGTPRRITFQRRVKTAAIATGLHEAVSFGFVSPNDLAACRVSKDAVPLANPLSVERSVMRTSLLPGLAWAAARARRHGARTIRLFEIGSEFHPNGASLPREPSRLAVFLLGESIAWFGSPRPLDFYDAKGHVEAIVHTLVGRVPTFALDDGLDARAPFLHPRRRARIDVEGETIGFVGELHPEVVDATDLGDRGLYAEIDLDVFTALAERLGDPQAKGLPRFPAVVQDLALVVPDRHLVGDIVGALEGASDGLVESIELFDEYRGDPVPPGHRSLAFRITYRDPEATLTDARVEAVLGRLVALAGQRFGASRR